MTSTTTLAAALPAEHRARLMSLAHEVSFDADTRLFEEGRHADRFWIIKTGTVALDLHVPGRRAAVIESLGHGELVGWSWHFPPYVWQLGAEAASPVRAYEFDADAVRKLCDEDPEFGRAVAVWVGKVVAHRLQSARIRLLDLYAPYGSGAE
ncbi:Crp/Fnr family transcriptional regulator [Streptomyces kebangsaanensis]|uniref:Crp/Fnr family transcriptional regulator n=1 Tax=Streptomyces kebangsaanensis TaxID=864058 RepID=UPI00093BBB12|nr:cyclic nucleotide-binding domain-containing protein [Streptomyces kebangsaanensis]